MYFMKNKGCEVQTIRTDQETEYSSNEISSLLKANGVEYAVTGRAAHGQIHVAERMKRTIK